MRRMKSPTGQAKNHLKKHSKSNPKSHQKNQEDEVAHWSGKKSHLKYHPNYQSKIILQKMRRMKSPTGQAKNNSNYHSK